MNYPKILLIYGAVTHMNKLKVTIASYNSNKIKEIRDILGELPVELKVGSLDDLVTPPEIVEDGKTFKANAVKKACSISQLVDGWVIGDDSGLAVEYLNGAPGVFSARYAGEHSSDLQNNEKLLKEMMHVPWEQRDAQFHCVMALVEPGGKVHLCEGVCCGKIGYELKGDWGFGYDPLFILPEYGDLTFAQLDPKIKNRISHRAKALTQLKQIIKKKIS